MAFVFMLDDGGSRAGGNVLGESALRDDDRDSTVQLLFVCRLCGAMFRFS